MKFFLDTASLEQVELWKGVGLVDGVTTNPALLASENCTSMDSISALLGAVDGPVSIQVPELSDSNRMIEQGRFLSGLATNVVVKIPATPPGYRATEQLLKEGVRINATMVFHPTQAIPFVRLGVEFVSLVIGKPEDSGHSNMTLLQDLLHVVAHLNGQTEIIACSIRNPIHLLYAVKTGSHAVTVSPKCWDLVFSCPEQKSALCELQAAWDSVPDELRRKFETSPS